MGREDRAEESQAQELCPRRTEPTYPCEQRDAHQSQAEDSLGTSEQQACAGAGGWDIPRGSSSGPDEYILLHYYYRSS